MKKSSEAKNQVAQFEYPMRVEVRQGEFEPLESIEFLDVDKLSQRSHKLCVGYVRGASCHAITYAIVRAGKVVDVTVEACKEPQKLTREAEAIVREAKRLGHFQKRAKWTPVPVKEFFSSPKQMAKIIISGWETEGGGCAQICWGSPPILNCLWCCRTGEQLECGHVQVVVEIEPPR